MPGHSDLPFAVAGQANSGTGTGVATRSSNAVRADTSGYAGPRRGVPSHPDPPDTVPSESTLIVVAYPTACSPSKDCWAVTKPGVNRASVRPRAPSTGAAA